MTPGPGQPRRRSRLTWALGALTLAALALASVGASREAWERGEIYMFTTRFFTDIPVRLAGPGRFRFILQPFMAVALGIRDGRRDGRAGRPIRGIAAGGARAIANLVMMAILLDAVFQWAILGVAHPIVALVIGPMLIAFPYSVARRLANRAART